MASRITGWAHQLGNFIDQRYRHWRARGIYMAQLAGSNSSEVEQLGSDLRLSPGELRDLVAAGPLSSNLLGRRMQVIGLDSPTAVDPQLKRELERCCSLCESKRECARDLAQDPASPRWAEYCPNEPTLNALAAIKCH
jgi:hypothetical protein